MSLLVACASVDCSAWAVSYQFLRGSVTVSQPISPSRFKSPSHLSRVITDLNLQYPVSIIHCHPRTSSLAMDLLSGSSQDQPVYEVLRINKRKGTTTTTIDRTDPSTGHSYPIYMVFYMQDQNLLELRHADPRLQNPDCTPLAAVKFHSLSSKLDLTLRGHPFRMARPHLLSGSHAFRYGPAAPELKWKERSEFSSDLVLVDGWGVMLARYRRKVRDGYGYKGPGFELFVPPHVIDLDLVVATGMAASRYHKREEEVVVAAVGEAVSSAE
ncbi:hypothetical protein SODALDRAFT_358038 [Sodiomyces alkalinus F11]|uniref:Uncharacterized protein n=1 Tax=Sodiomyces alkalinus (strain CBS 110278 / VKM F-3762 / F11) TaxID=1314773 RepID=A0A3N2PYQ0_SODAK|nr:hypothetical protein SODALDRAFT_358038 [Sodiomyces alkalinus F11]ROT39627.1 hypothetical protein SODALDRAFT_358038 [Sodiomyces alkalinus F11]